MDACVREYLAYFTLEVIIFHIGSALNKVCCLPPLFLGGSESFHYRWRVSELIVFTESAEWVFNVLINDLVQIVLFHSALQGLVTGDGAGAVPHGDGTAPVPPPATRPYLIIFSFLSLFSTVYYLLQLMMCYNIDHN